ncbi:MAG: hypothetical protein WAT71_04110 [Ignavibacteria bacterium]
MKNSLKLLSVILLLLLSIFSTQNSYSANEYFRSITTGNWNSTSTWEMSTNGGATWFSATSTPTNLSSTITITVSHVVTVTADVTADQIVIQNGGNLSIDSGITLMYPGGTFTFSNATVSGAGTFKITTSMNLDLKGVFSAGLKIATGSTVVATDFSSPFVGRLYGPVTVDSGAILSSYLATHGIAYSLEFYGDLTNNGTITSSTTGSNNKRHSFYGSNLVNNGIINPYIFSMDSVSNVSGAGIFSPTNYLRLNTNGNITLLSNVTFSPANNFFVAGNLNPNGNTVNFTSGTLELQSGGIIENSGLVKTQNTVTLNLRNGSFFNAPLNVSAGSFTRATDLTSPRIGRLYGPVTVDAGGTLGSYLTFHNSDFNLEFYGNLTNNGTITSAPSNAYNKRHTFYGSTLINNGIINPSIFNMDTVSTLSGTGTFSPYYLGLSTNGNINLLSDVIFSPENSFNIAGGATLNPNGNTINYTSGTLVLNSGAEISGSGLVKTQNWVVLNLRAGSAFNAPLNVTSGSTVTATDLTSPYLGKLFGDVSVDAGGTLGSYINFFNTSFSLDIYGNVTNNGTITANTAVNKTLSFYGSTFVNNGLVSHPYFNFKSVATLSGTGSFTSNLSFVSPAVVTLTSDHKFANAIIAAGAAFDISNNLVKFTSSNPISQSGTFTTTGSDIEYNGIVLQSVSTTNINYVGLRINNPAGATLLDNINIPDTLAIISGDLNLNAKIITLTPSAYMTETTGNTVFGTSGYITTTRNIDDPSGLNVAGMGAVLTTSEDLGSTEIRRGHAVQNGLNGGTSIKRYYDITPANNSNLNATLVYNYDDTELDGTPEPSIKLFKSLNSGVTWTYQGGIVNVIANQITLTGIDSFSRWSSDSSAVSVTVKLAFEAFYNAGLNRMNYSDTVKGYFRNSVSPYAVVDSAKEIVNLTTMKVGLQFNIAPIGTYYLQLKHRNAIETWTATGLTYNPGTTLNHDFTSAANKAFGNNQNQVDAAPLTFAFWSGDVNQDGFIDVTDGGLIDNDATNFVTGYVPTDVNGDDIVDVEDAVFADNNGLNFIGKITP